MIPDTSLPPAVFDGQGAFNRRMIAIATQGRVDGGLEDDFHRVELSLTHRDGRVTAIKGRFPRPPFDSCPLAAGKLAELVGMPVGASAWHLPESIQAKLHCTHMLDLALFAMAQAGRGGRRQYDFMVEDGNEEVRARTMRDGALAVEWIVQGKAIVGPPGPFAGRSMVELGRWALTLEDDDLREAIILLRRARRVSGGRMQHSYTPTAGAMMARMQGACFTYQPGNEEAQRHMWSIRDFAGHPQDLLAGFPNAT